MGVIDFGGVINDDEDGTADVAAVDWFDDATTGWDGMAGDF